jgi:hypothetical protein
VRPLPKNILYLSIFFGLLRAVLLFHHNPNLIMNIDEESNFEVATNHFKGRGYTYFDPEKNGYYPTAFHGSFTIFVYENLILKQHIHKRKWVSFCNIVSALFLCISIIFFYRLSQRFLPEKLVLYATLLYAVFPPVVYYIGTLFWYEQIVLSWLIIIVYYVIKAINSTLKPLEWMFLIVLILLSTLFRLQTITILLPLLVLVAGYSLYKKKYFLTSMMLLTLTLGMIAHIPSLKKNKDLYGKYMLSTQMGYEILQGHNPHAKGSWMGDWLLPSSALYQYSHQQIPNLKNLNQYEEGVARQQVAVNWMKQHPLEELKLQFRKVALYFLPRNFEFLPYNQWLNPLNFIVYAGFLAYVFWLIKNKCKPIDISRLILLMPFIGSITLTLVFFMGARWRYYAEPFMIIFMFMWLHQIWPNINILKNKFEGFQK